MTPSTTNYMTDSIETSEQCARPYLAAKPIGSSAHEPFEAVLMCGKTHKPMSTHPQLQPRVLPWLLACFGEAIAADIHERNHRFLEEALELVQAGGCSRREAHQLVDYVYDRPVGEMAQEVGGVMITLAALCLAHGLDMHEAGEAELARIWTMVDAIRAKQAAKPKHSPLPQHAPARVPTLKGWAFTLRDNGDILVHGPGSGCLVSEKATERRAMPEEILHQLATALMAEAPPMLTLPVREMGAASA